MTRLEIYDEEYRFLKKDIMNSVHDIPSYQNIYTHIRWRKNDHLHRLNGPAFINSDGVKQWYENGEHIKTEYPKK